MQISRNNYEEYFLLYIDGELSNADRHAVEQFVALHPDLAEELDLLKESMLPIDELIQMPGKAQLMKQVEWKEEEIASTREDLFLYIDNELDEARKMELEEQLANDIQLKQELQSIAKTKLDVEPVVMPSKEELYRTEKDRKPIPIRWTRWVATAAAIVGIGWFSLTKINKESAVAPELAGTTETKGSSKTITPTDIVAVPKTQEQTQDAAGQTQEVIQYASVDAETNKKTNTTNTVVVTASNDQQKTFTKPDDRDLVQNMSNQIAAVLPPTGIEGNNPDLNQVGAPPVDVRPVINTSAVQQGKPTDNAQSSPYQYASYEENIEDENPYVNIAGAHISKQKLRGVFRNVTRTVSRTFDKSTVSEAKVASL